MSNETPSFVDILRQGLREYHAWGPNLMGSDAERLEARRERRGIETAVGDLLVRHPMDFVELLVSLADRVDEIDGRFDRENQDSPIGYLHLRIDEAMDRGHR